MSTFSKLSNYVCHKRDVEIKESYNVVIIGGGSAGLCAAIASARAGAKTLLIEKNGYLGGIGTAGLMVEFGPIKKKDKRILGGIPYELMQRMKEFGGAELRTYETENMLFTPESFSMTATNMCLESGVEILLHTYFVDCILKENKIQYVILENKEGCFAYHADVVIDASGDGDVFFKAGLDYQIGRESDNKAQPMTLVFFLDNVNYKKFLEDENFGRCKKGEENKEFGRLMKIARDKGSFNIPIERPGSIGPVPKIGRSYDLTCCEVFINSTNILNHSGVNAKELTEAEILARKQVLECYYFFREYIPGFENCYISQIASSIGVRESRKLKGKYILTSEDMLSFKYFEDTIAIGFNMLDIHQVDNIGFNLRSIKEGKFYTIPYSSLFSDSISNLLVAGRCVSATHEALSAIRVMVNTMPIGEAAGTAAALAALEHCEVQSLDICKLRNTLIENGVKLYME